MLYIVTKENLKEMFDFDSDFHVRRHADDAQRWNNTILRMIECGREDFAGGLARHAARAGALTLEIIERRGSDDLEFFCTDNSQGNEIR